MQVVPPGAPSAAMLADLVASAPVAIAVVDAGGRLSVANAALAAMTRRPLGELLGARARELLPERAHDLLEVGRRVLDGGPAVHAVHVVTGERSFSCDVFAVRGEDGQAAVACLAVETTDQRRLESDRAFALDLLALTSRASELLAASLEPAVVLEHLCDLLVPALADHVYVDLHEEGYRLRRAAIRHAGGVAVDTSLERPVGHLSHYAEDHPIRRALERSEVVLVPDATVEADIPRTEDTQLLRVMGATSVMVLPMVVGGRPVGTVGMFCSEAASGRHYGAGDVAVAQEVVRRGAVALANARSYAQQRSAAIALQRSLLPTRMPAPEALEVAWRYEPGTRGTQVGGDWVDVVELPAGRAAVVIGDVMGRGLRAAAVMGQLRTAVRTLAQQDLQPSDLLARLDAIVQGLPGDQLVTCVYAVHDPGRGLLTVANAGHLPPLLRLPDGDVVALEEPLGTPLGVDPDLALGVAQAPAPEDGGRQQRDVPLPPGSVLALCTDGLVERRDADLGTNLDLLARALQRAPAPDDGDLDGLAQHLLEVAPVAPEQAGGYDDDVALLLVRPRTAADAAALRRFSAVPASVSAARRFLAEVLQAWGTRPDELVVPTAELLVSELVTNAVRYAAGEVEVLLRRSGGGVERGGRRGTPGWRTLWVEVVDGDTRLPRLRRAAPDDEGGRGLALVQALASGWGSRPTPDGKAVWFRVER